MSIKLENDNKQNQRSRLKEIIKQRIKSQSITQPTERTIEETAEDHENERNLKNQLKKGILQRTEPLSIAQTPFIKEMETDEESETEEEFVETTEEQEERQRLIHTYLTSTMEKENEQKEQNDRRELLHAYSKHTMDNYDEQTEQDETDTYLRTSAEEEQKSSMKEENDDEGKWTTQFSYPTEEEENALFKAFMTGNVEDQKTWINAKMNLARASPNEETRRREEEILDRIIPTGIMDKAFEEEEDEEETDDFSECRPYDLTIDQEEDFVWKDYQVYSSDLLSFRTREARQIYRRKHRRRGHPIVGIS